MIEPITNADSIFDELFDAYWPSWWIAHQSLGKAVNWQKSHIQPKLRQSLQEGTGWMIRAGVVIGWAWVQPTTAGLYLSKLYIRPNYMGQGLGTALLQEAEQFASEQQYGTLSLNTWVGGVSWQWYMRRGFQYAGYREDIIIGETSCDYINILLQKAMA